MAQPAAKLPRQHKRACEQCQTAIKFHCVQPPIPSMPVLVRPPFDPQQFAHYHPNTLDSQTHQSSLLSEDLGTVRRAFDMGVTLVFARAKKG